MFTKPASDDKWTWRGLVGRFEKSSLIWIWKECQLRLREMYTMFSLLAVDQLLSHVRFSETPWTVAHQAPLSSAVHMSWLKFTSIEPVILSNHLILCHPLLLLSSIFPSIRVFSNELTLLLRWPKYRSFSFSISPYNEYSGRDSGYMFTYGWFTSLYSRN